MGLIRFHWYWNLFLGVLENFPWDVSEPDIQIFFPHRFLESCSVVPVGCSHFFSSIDCFSWSKISIELFIQSFLCWLLTCVYHIYWIRVNWSWNLTLVVLTNCMWVVSKPDILICFPCRFVEGWWRGYRVLWFTCHRQYIDCLQGSYSSFLLDIDI